MTYQHPNDLDYPFDKGQYPNRCLTCDEWFIGNKGRMYCRTHNVETKPISPPQETK